VADKKLLIAIDGPAGSGKSTVARLVAQKLGLRLLDTGAMYRCLALEAMNSGLEPTQGEDAAAMARTAFNLRFEGQNPQRVFLNGEDVTDAIRTPEVSAYAAQLSAQSPVRRVMVAKQKEIIEEGDYVMEGRDTTTVVAPQADVKVFLTASIEERARRRYEQDKLSHPGVTLEKTVQQVLARDQRDYSRQDSPLKFDGSAHLVESYRMTPEEVADYVISLIPPSQQSSS
jgi:cytidylate kinase